MILICYFGILTSIIWIAVHIAVKRSDGHLEKNLAFEMPFYLKLKSRVEKLPNGNEIIEECYGALSDQEKHKNNNVFKIKHN
tara:strand:- start:283 stop:528 length:246 start_codon:yes stop_codon:yes gene_type:complete